MTAKRTALTAIKTTLMAFFFFEASGQVLSGKIQLSDRWQPVLHIWVLEDFENEGYSDSISLERDGSFTYAFSPQQIRAGLIRISIVQYGWGRRYSKEGVGENSVVIPVNPFGNMVLYADAEELYFSHRLEPAVYYSAAGKLRDLKKPFRDLLLRMEDAARSMDERKDQEVVREEWEDLLDSYRLSVMPFMDSVNPEGIRLLGLYNYFLSSRGRYDTLVFRRVLGKISDTTYSIIRNLNAQLLKETDAGRLAVLPLPLLENRGGSMVHLNDMHAVYYVLDFWASWCSPCRKAMKNTLPQLNKAFVKRNILLIGINVDEKRKDWIQVLQAEKPEWPQFRDHGGSHSLTKQFNVTGFPTYLILDHQLRLVYKTSSEYEIRHFLDERVVAK